MTGGGTAAPRRGLVGGALATIAVRGIDLPSVTLFVLKGPSP